MSVVSKGVLQSIYAWEILLLRRQQKREYSVIRLLFGYLHHSENRT